MGEKDRLLSKLKKVQELAINGTKGEKANAELMLQGLLIKYEISNEELNQIEVPKFRTFKYNKNIPFSKDLIAQIMYSVVGPCPKYKIRNRYEMGVDCTRIQAAEIEARYYFYVGLLRKDLEMFYSAFINKHDIFHESAEVIKHSEDEGFDSNKFDMMMECMTDGSYHLQLE